MVYLEEFWQAGDGDDWAPAFLRAQRSVNETAGQGAPFQILFHAPRVYTFLDYAEVISAVELLGQRADAGNMPKLHFPSGHGLRTHFLGSYQPDLNAGSQLLIDGLCLQGSMAGSGFTHHGVFADSGFDIRNTRITDFGGDGFHIEASTSAPIPRPGGGLSPGHYVWLQACRIRPSTPSSYRENRLR